MALEQWLRDLRESFANISFATVHHTVGEPIRTATSFSAEKRHNKKGVIAMKYTKPEITSIAEATTAICLDNSSASPSGFDDQSASDDAAGVLSRRRITPNSGALGFSDVPDVFFAVRRILR